MSYHKEIFYQPADGLPHKKVTVDELFQKVGVDLAHRALLRAQERTYSGNRTPEVEAFFRGDITRAVIVTSLTSRGNIYIEVVQDDEEDDEEPRKPLETKQDLIDVLIANGIVGSADEWNKLSFYWKEKKCGRLVKLPQYDEEFAAKVGFILEEFDPTFKSLQFPRNR